MIHNKFTKDELIKANEQYDSYTKAGASLGIPCKVFRRQLFKALNLVEPSDPNKKLCRRCYREFSRLDENDKSWRRIYVCTECKTETLKKANLAYRHRTAIVRRPKNTTDEHRAKMRKWSRENKHKIAHYKAVRRSKYKKGNTPEVKNFIERLFKNPDKKCRYCPETSKLTLEHIVPISRGGLHECNNLDLACSTCNSSKRARTEQEYFEYLSLIKGDANGT